MQTGKIRSVNPRGFYFITKDDDDGGDIFGHATELRGVDFDSIAVGDRVSFTVGEGRNGRPCALGVELMPAQY